MVAPKPLSATTVPTVKEIIEPPSLRTKAGRPPVRYTPELALEVCELVADGETLTAICQRDGMPSKPTFHRWVIQYPEVARAYAAAREMSAYALEEDALVLGRHLIDHPGNAQRVRAFDLLMNQLRWSAARRNPRVFSERGAVQITVPIQINTDLDLGAGVGEENTREYPDIFKIDLTAEVITDPGESDIPVTSEDRVNLMSDTAIPSLATGEAPDRTTKRKSKAELRREHFAKHGARGAARRKDIINEE